MQKSTFAPRTGTNCIPSVLMNGFFLLAFGTPGGDSMGALAASCADFFHVEKWNSNPTVAPAATSPATHTNVRFGRFTSAAGTATAGAAATGPEDVGAAVVGGAAMGRAD